MPHIVGLLGGIASGKSTVAGLFAEAGWQVVDADQIARELTTRPEVLAGIRERFGPGFVSADGRLDRARLAALVFGDVVARRQLEELLHPHVLVEIERRLAAFTAQGSSVVLDVPLLLETGLDRSCTDLLFVEVPDAVRLQRALARGWTEAEWRQREAAQIPCDAKRSHARYVVNNDRPTEQTRLQVRSILAQLAP